MEKFEQQFSVWLNRIVLYGAPLAAVVFGILHAFGIDLNTGEVHQLWTWAAPAILTASVALSKNPQQLEADIAEAEKDFPFDSETGELIAKVVSDTANGDFNVDEIKDVLNRISKILTE